MKDFTLITAWATSRQPGTQIQLHTHDFYEVVYYLRGAGYSGIGGTRHPIAPHSFVVIPPMSEHEESHTSEGDLFCIGFQSPEPLTEQMQQDANGAVCQIGKAIIQEISEQHPFYERMAAVKLQELVLEILRLEHTSPKSTSKSFEYVINYLSQNYHEKIIMRTMAEQLHISYDYFQHRFKEIQGVSPQQFLMQTRLRAAAQLLESTALSCTEIAYRCGFSNSAQFSAIFKREMGVAPRDFQKSSKKQVR